MLRVMRQDNGSTAEAKPFAAQAGEVLLEVRTAVGQMLEACGVPVQTVQRSYRQLGVDKMLAWRLSKVLQADDPFSTARHMPGAAAMRSLFERAEAEHVSPQLIERARRSIEQLDAFIQEHAESRRAFELMLSAHAGQDLEETDLVHRKEATRALSYIWGVLARAQILTYICRPDHAGAIDVVAMGGVVDMQWIRPNVGWIVNQRMRFDEVGGELPIGEHRPLDPGLQPGDVPLLRDYCSTPFPPMQRVHGAHGLVMDEIIQSNVGRSSTTTCLIGEINYGWMPRYVEEDWEECTYNVRARTPTEVFVFDYLVHRDIEMASPPSLAIYGDLESRLGSFPRAVRERRRLMPWKKLE